MNLNWAVYNALFGTVRWAVYRTVYEVVIDDTETMWLRVEVIQTVDWVMDEAAHHDPTHPALSDLLAAVDTEAA